MFRKITMLKKIIIAACAFSLVAAGQDKVDLAALHKIKNEAFQNSKVMDHMFYLTDVHGPRLTNSPGYFAAADWVVKELNGWGIPAKTEKWGPFGKGWQLTHFSAHMTEPQYAPLIGFPSAWTAGTNGVIKGEPMFTEMATEADLEKYKGKLKGKIVMIGAPRDLSMSLNPLGRRYTDIELDELMLAPDPGAAGGRPPIFIGGAQANPQSGRGGRGGRSGRGGAAAADGQAAGDQPGAQPGAPPDREAQRRFQAKLNQFLIDEGALLSLRGGAGRSEGGTVFSNGGRPPAADAKDMPLASVVITPEHYNRIARLMAHGIPVKLEFDVQTKFTDANDSVNVVGEIAGSGKNKDQIVMVGAHLDSWHSGTGATDNAAGSAVMIEVMRILKQADLKLNRSVRIGLWGGEEEGLLGSRAYVKEHFADPATMKTTAEHARLSGYFNIDNGTGKVRGVYLQGNDMMRPVFESWFAPLKDLGVRTITIRNTSGTDHLSFDAVGLPGFQFIQDPMEYDSRTHHSNMDVYDRIQRGDMMQIAAVVATCVYQTANREEQLPRKPLPKPQPQRGTGGAATGPSTRNQ